MNPDTTTKTWLRVALALFGAFLSAQAVWILLAERHRLNHIRLPVDGKTATMAFAEQDNIKQAASLAVVRGDLWAESAFSYGSQLWTDRVIWLDAGERLDTEALRNFDPSPAIFTASRGTSGSCSRPWQINTNVKISAEPVAQDVLLHGAE